MKKILAILLTVIMVFGLVACGDKKDDQAKDTDKAEEVEQDADEKDAETPAEGSGKVYYLNFKPEQDQQWQELAEVYTQETGVAGYSCHNSFR